MVLESTATVCGDSWLSQIRALCIYNIQCSAVFAAAKKLLIL